jgi:hypothetical protein
MTDSNRVRLTHIREATLGTTPVTPRMREVRFTAEALSFKPVFVQSEELRYDRMNSDQIKVNETHGGSVNGELSWPPDNSPWSDWLESVMGSQWVNTPARDNDGVADSVITAVTASSDTYTVTTGDAFVTGMLVRASGFTAAGNNGLFRVESGSGATSVVVPSSPGLTDEAAPPAAARLKVVGLQGASGDLVAAADGITSTSLDFTTLGLAVGQWIKIGGTGSAFRFATAACNGWARIIAIAATKLTLDNLPATWTTDAGTGKTLRVFFGDRLKNGVEKLGQTLERGFLGQDVPVYMVDKGMVCGQMELSFPYDDKATWVATFMGMSGGVGTTSLDDTPDAATTNPIMAAGVNAGRIAENGAAVLGPNFVRSLTLSINGNLREQGAIRGDGSFGPVGIGVGSLDVMATPETYFGSDTLLNKLFAGTPTNINARLDKDGQALVFAVPRMVFGDGVPNAGGKNQDVMLSMPATASKDPLTEAHLLIDRLEYVEN